MSSWIKIQYRDKKTNQFANVPCNHCSLGFIEYKKIGTYHASKCNWCGRWLEDQVKGELIKKLLKKRPVSKMPKKKKYKQQETTLLLNPDLFD